MALQALHQSNDPSCVLRQGTCVVHGLQAGDILDQTAELIALRARVEELEAALAAAQSPATVVPLRAVVDNATSAPTHAEAESGDEPASADSFAAAWTEEDASFEQRFAARAFFQETSVDERSRRWFLGK